MPNNHFGVMLCDSSNNTIGGVTAGSGNIISGNLADGVDIVHNISQPSACSLENNIQGNFIGTLADGTTPLGNVRQGIDIQTLATCDHTVGGTSAGQANVIAYSGGTGVHVTAGTHESIVANRIFSNGASGIVLDSGANNNQSAPTLSASGTNGVRTSIQGVVSTGAAAGTSYTWISSIVWRAMAAARPGTGVHRYGDSDDDRWRDRTDRFSVPIWRNGGARGYRHRHGHRRRRVSILQRRARSE